MGNSSSRNIMKANHEDLSDSHTHADAPCIISTLGVHEQDVLIENTVACTEEIAKVDFAIKSGRSIVIYGKNSNDDSIYRKYEQIVALGHKNVYVYPGGLFEWLLLQDVFGEDAFRTTKKTLDILSYKPRSHMNIKYLEN
jgi:hypothetical protein